jgi:transposase InsO family protein
MCKTLGVSKSGYYAWKPRKPSLRAVENKEITERIHRVHAQSKGTYGSPRVTDVLRDEGVSVSRPRVARLMNLAGLSGEQKPKFVSTTQSDHSYRIADNLLNRQFSWPFTGQAWVSDITYIHTLDGWLYLTVIIDLATRRVIGWSLSSDMTTENTVIDAWKMALLNYPIDKPLIFHSDRGVQYAADSFTGLLSDQHLVTQSMSRKGNCWDNAVAESFFKTLKSECIYRQQILTKKETELAVFEYIETWYNTRRKHSTIMYRTPMQQEQIIFQQTQAA